MVAKVLADVVQVQRVRNIRIHQGHYVAEGTEGACLDFQLGSQIVDDSVGDSTCNLRENGHSMF